jgi:hypothetical protein
MSAECVLEFVENAGSDPGMVNEIVGRQLKHHAKEGRSRVYGTASWRKGPDAICRPAAGRTSLIFSGHFHARA